MSSCHLFFPDFDSEELEKELDILLRDTTKEPLDLPENPPETFYTNSVPNPRISDAELEAELEKLSLSEGGMELYSQGCRWAWGPLVDSSPHRVGEFQPQYSICQGTNPVRELRAHYLCEDSTP